MAGRLGFLRFGAQLTGALLLRPQLLGTAVRQAVTMAPQRWWTRSPYLPMPPADYLDFRQVTATGDSDGPPGVEDTMLWLEWCRSMRKLPPR